LPSKSSLAFIHIWGRSARHDRAGERRHGRGAWKQDGRHRFQLTGELWISRDGRGGGGRSCQLAQGRDAGRSGGAEAMPASGPHLCSQRLWAPLCPGASRAAATTARTLPCQVTSEQQAAWMATSPTRVFSGEGPGGACAWDAHPQGVAGALPHQVAVVGGLVVQVLHKTRQYNAVRYSVVHR
jgi:hypothetical protein